MLDHACRGGGGSRSLEGALKGQVVELVRRSLLKCATRCFWSWVAFLHSRQKTAQSFFIVNEMQGQALLITPFRPREKLPICFLPTLLSLFSCYLVTLVHIPGRSLLGRCFFQWARCCDSTAHLRLAEVHLRDSSFAASSRRNKTQLGDAMDQWAAGTKFCRQIRRQMRGMLCRVLSRKLRACFQGWGTVRDATRDIEIQAKAVLQCRLQLCAAVYFKSWYGVVAMRSRCVLFSVQIVGRRKRLRLRSAWGHWQNKAVDAGYEWHIAQLMAMSKIRLDAMRLLQHSLFAWWLWIEFNRTTARALSVMHNRLTSRMTALVFSKWRRLQVRLETDSRSMDTIGTIGSGHT